MKPSISDSHVEVMRDTHTESRDTHQFASKPAVSWMSPCCRPDQTVGLAAGGGFFFAISQCSWTMPLSTRTMSNQFHL